MGILQDLFVQGLESAHDSLADLVRGAALVGIEQLWFPANDGFYLTQSQVPNDK